MQGNEIYQVVKRALCHGSHGKAVRIANLYPRNEIITSLERYIGLIDFNGCDRSEDYKSVIQAMLQAIGNDYNYPSNILADGIGTEYMKSIGRFK